MGAQRHLSPETEDLLARVREGTASEDDLATFRREKRSSPGERAREASHEDAKWRKGPNAYDDGPWSGRFWSKVHPEALSGCWLWHAAVCHRGYGRYRLPKGFTSAHRFAYQDRVGPIPKGLVVCHRCDVPACCNPDHLFLGTMRENSLDMVAKDRHLPGERSKTAILTDAKVREIRHRRAKGEKLKTIAADMGTSSENIRLVATRRSWAHLPDVFCEAAGCGVLLGDPADGPTLCRGCLDALETQRIREVF